jgi:N-acetylglucosamine repressor
MSFFTSYELRLLNAMVVLHRPTRTALVEKTGFSLARISSLLTALERSGTVRKSGKTESKGGRPSSIFELHPDLGYTVGVAIHLKRLNIVMIDAREQIVYERDAPLDLSSDPTSHFDGIVEAVSREVHHVLEESIAQRRVLGVGLAVPGLLDTRRGLWLQGLQLTGINHVNPARELEKRLGLPVFQEDITRSLACYEMLRGQGRGTSDFILMHIDMGLGTALVLNGEIYRGIHGVAGEFGHIPHPNSQYRCSCNNIGCLETIVSTPGILRMFQERLQEGVRSTLQYYADEGNRLTLEAIRDAARDGDRFARTTLDEIGHFIGDACAILIKLLNPGRIIISGPVCIFRDFLNDAIYQVLTRQVFQEMLEDFKLSFADYRSNQEAYGVALFALESYFRFKGDSGTNHQANRSSIADRGAVMPSPPRHEVQKTVSEYAPGWQKTIAAGKGSGADSPA